MWDRRSILRGAVTAGLLTAGGAAGTVVGDRDGGGDTDGDTTPTDTADARLAWRQSYPDAGRIQAVAPTGDGGFVYGAVPPGDEMSPNAVRLTAVDALGRVRRRVTVTPAASTGVGGDTPCALARTETGYALARGGWLALLDGALRVRTTVVAPPTAEVNGDETSLLARRDGVAVAQTRWLPQGVETHVHGVGADGTHRWTARHGHRFEASFLAPAARGVAVGGTEIDRGRPWVAVHGPDGTRRWRAVYDADEGGETTAAVADADGLTLARADGLLRVGWDGRRRRWESFRAFPGVAPDRQALRAVFDRPDGGFVLVGSHEGTPTRVAAVGVTADLRREWGVDTAVDGEPTAFTAGGDGDPERILVAGGGQSGASGFALVVSGAGAEAPTVTASPTANGSTTAPPTATASEATPTTTGTTGTTGTATETTATTTETTPTTTETAPTTTASTPTAVPTPTATGDSAASSTVTPPTDTTASATQTRLPGFGAAAALTALGGLGRWLARRHREA